MDENVTEKPLERHYQDSALISASAEEVFAYIDNHANFSSHMNNSSWMMGGGKMDTQMDEKMGQAVGSHIKMSGSVFGIKLFLDEGVTQHQPPKLKVWETVGDINLLVIGQYQMKVEIIPNNNQSQLTVSIDYNLPDKNIWLGKLFGGFYAKWCVQQMLQGTKDHFNLT